MKRAISFNDFCILCENEAIADGRKGAAANYRKVRIKLKSFPSGSTLRISDITSDWVKSFNDRLFSLGLEKSSISFYNRCIRSVYNQAVKKSLVKNTHPFDGICTNTPFTHTPVVVDLDDENGKRIPLETLTREELITSYKTLAYKYNDILFKLKGGMAL